MTTTAAQQRAQVARLTRENNALIRLVLGLLDTPNQSLDTAALRKAVKDEARALRRLIRHVLAAYDATD